MAETAAESPRTVTARKQFVEMVKVCAATTISDTVLADVYARRIADRNADVAMIARYGMGVIHLHRGEYAQAIAEWTRAVEEFPDGDSIRPLLDELRNRTSTDRP